MSASRQGTERHEWRLTIGFWAVIAALLAIRAALTLPEMSIYIDHDDVMRLVTATDLLNGQAWQDTAQHRDNAPFGIDMHWSRLVDAPLALLMAPFPAPLAHHVAAIVWPLLLMLPLLILCARIILRLVPDAGQITAISLPIVTLAILIEFMPGRVDHHNVQIILSLVALLALLYWRQRVFGGVVAGLAMATSLAIGLEALLVVGIGAACYGLLWTSDPVRYHRPVVAFGVALFLGAVFHFFLATAPVRYPILACDVLSPVQLTAIGLGLAALLGATMIGGRFVRAWQRFALLAIGGAVALALTQLWFPGCLFNPYGGLQPEFSKLLFSTIKEVQSLWTRLHEDPATGVAFSLPVLIAVPLTAMRAWRSSGEARVDWLITFAFLITATIVMLVQMRGARIAAPFALPAAAWAIVMARRAYLQRPRVATAMRMVGIWLLFAGIIQFGVISGIATLISRPDSATATMPAAAVARAYSILLPTAYEKLASLPPGNVVAPQAIDVYVLLNTPHSVLNAGFHRSAQSFLDLLTFKSGSDEATARRIAEERQLDYVLTYSGLDGYGAIRTWSWLKLISSPDDAIQIYQVEL